MCIVLCATVQITMCFYVTIPFHTSPSMCHHAWSCCIQGQILSYAAQFSTTLRNKGYCESGNAQINKSLRKICHYQLNVPQHYYRLDTLVSRCLLKLVSCGTSTAIVSRKRLKSSVRTELEAAMLSSISGLGEARPE